MPTTSTALNANYPLSGDNGAPTLAEGECAVLVFYDKNNKNNKNLLSVSSGAALLQAYRKPDSHLGLYFVVGGQTYPFSSRDWLPGHRWVALPDRVKARR